MCCCGAADMADSRASCCNDRDTICSASMCIRERGVDDDRRNSRWQEQNSDSNTVKNKQYCRPQTGARIVGCTLVHETNSSGGDLPPHYGQFATKSSFRMDKFSIVGCTRMHKLCTSHRVLQQYRACVKSVASFHGTTLILCAVHGNLLPLHCVIFQTMTFYCKFGPTQSSEAPQIKAHTDSCDAANAFCHQNSPSRCHHLLGPRSGLLPHLPGVASKGDP